MRKLFIIFIALFLMPLTNAVTNLDVPLPSSLGDSFGTFKQGDSIVLVQTCSNSSGSCDSCNITSVNYPNGTAIISLAGMTKTETLFNRTLSGASTKVIGKYTVTGFCYAGGVYSPWAYSFDVTLNGFLLSQAQATIYAIFFLSSFFVFCFVFYWAIKLPYRNTRTDEGMILEINDMKYVKIFLICMSYIIGWFLAGLLRGVTANYIPDIGVYKFFGWVYAILLAFMWPLIVASLLLALISFLNDKKIHDAILRGIPTG